MKFFQFITVLGRSATDLQYLSFVSFAVILVILFVFSLVTGAIWRRFFSPISKYPGLFLASITR